MDMLILELDVNPAFVPPHYVDHFPSLQKKLEMSVGQSTYPPTHYSS